MPYVYPCCGGHNISRKRIAFIVVVLIIISGVGGFWLIDEYVKPDPPHHKTVAHEPICIDSNDDFDGSHGVTGGSGTKDDPWVIRNWKIDGEGRNHCIYIGNTTDHFVIKNCYLQGADRRIDWDPLTTRDMNAGIVLYRVQNGVVKNTTIRDNRMHGIYLGYSDYNKVHECDINNNTEQGVFVYNGAYHNEIRSNILENNSASGIELTITADYNIVEDNVVRYNGYTGIDAEGMSDGVVAENQVYRNMGYGIALGWDSGGNQVINNTVSRNNHSGILCYEKENTIIGNVLKYNNRSGMSLIHSKSCLVKDNEIFQNNLTGMMIQGECRNNVISSNTVSKNPVGIEVNRDWRYHNSRSVRDNLILNNKIKENEVGFQAIGMKDNEIISNDFLFNLKAVRISKNEDTLIFDNTILGGEKGIEFDDSVNCHVVSNRISHCGIYGIKFYDEHLKGYSNNEDYRISSNKIRACDTGINIINQQPESPILGFDNYIVNNLISNSRDYGVKILEPDYINFYHNNFVNNTQPVYQKYEDEAFERCYFNAEYPKGGNYWSGFEGRDRLEGKGQNKTGSDDFYDKPYDLTEGISDRYPSVEKFDVTPPEIYDDKVVYVTESEAAMSWDTDELADCTLYYSAEQALRDSKRVNVSETDVAHRVVLKNLTAGKRYYFKVVAEDVHGNTNILTGKDGYHSFRVRKDSDDDLIMDWNDEDDDNDGIPDDWERWYGLDPKDPDDASKNYDADDLNNYEEYKKGTDPREMDTDNDGYLDHNDGDPTEAHVISDTLNHRYCGCFMYIFLMIFPLVMIYTLAKYWQSIESVYEKIREKIKK